MTKLVVLLAVVACSKSDEQNPGPAADPWASSTPPADDPWAEKAAPAASEPPQKRSGGTSTLAGSYQCQQLRYVTTPTGMQQSSYVSSALGVFEIDGDGAYRSSSYATKGDGRARVDATTVTFEGGAYANAVGQAGTTSSGFYIRFSENLTDAPTPNMRFNDHMCYRK